MDKIRFQLDEHVPLAIMRALRSRGIDAVTAAEAGSLGLPDEEVLNRCYTAGRLLVTHDDDFLRLHGQYPHAGIAYSKQGERTIGQLVASLVLIYEALEPADAEGNVEFL